MCFLTSGLEINVRAKCGLYPLHLAVLSHDKDLVIWIIGQGGDTNAFDKDEETPLTYAVKYELKDIAMVIVTAKADKTSPNKDQSSEPDCGRYLCADHFDFYFLFFHCKGSQH